MLLSRQKIQKFIEVKTENTSLIKEASLTVLDVATVVQIALLGIVILEFMNRGYRKYKNRFKVKIN